MRTSLLLLLVAACTPPSSTPASMPWLQGFNLAASSDVVVSDVTKRMPAPRDCEEPCPDYGGIELAADIAPQDGIETILASYTQGVVVLDRSGKLLALRSAFPPTGSADELVALAAGEAQPGMQVIAIATRAGGHREQEVRLELARITGGTFETVFSAVVEEHDGRGDAIGRVAIVPGGVLYTAPRTEAAVFRPFELATSSPAAKSPRRTRPPGPSR